MLQLAVLGMLWKRYKRTIVATLLLFAYLWLVGVLHEDYVSYTELNQDNDHLALSFIIKWMAFIIGLLVYLLFHIFASPFRKTQPLESIDVNHVKPGEQLIDDPFAEIRHQKKLRSKADFIIEKKKNPSE